MIANARMYSVTPDAAERWRTLLIELAARAGVPLELISHPAPRPLDELWDRPDLGAVFMCGLPFSSAAAPRYVLAAPVPAAREFGSAPLYWSNFVVKAESRFRSVSDTFGHRLALTVPGSQSGFAAALRYFCANPGPEPRFEELIFPTISPRGALCAVVDGAADLAPIDAYAFRLLERFDPQLTAAVRVIGRTETTPIPVLVSSERPAPRLQAAFIEAHVDPAVRALMDDLMLERFVIVAPDSYRPLRDRYARDLAYWQWHALAAKTHPAFGLPGHGLRGGN